ncbi:MAG: hypothetical protein MJ222_03190 [Bacilli bacterium]|nr:hypothetical protein [Bacilli bacterium]
MPKYFQDDLKKLAKLTRKASKCQKVNKNSFKTWQKVKRTRNNSINVKKRKLS